MVIPSRGRVTKVVGTGTKASSELMWRHVEKDSRGGCDDVLTWENELSEGYGGCDDGNGTEVEGE